MPSAPTYADGEYEDDKADMVAKLMKNHSNIVSSSLVERSNLISRVTWLSHHVPGCVLKSLLEPIMRARKRANMKSLPQRKEFYNGDHEMKQSCDGNVVAAHHVKAEHKAKSPFLNSLPPPKSLISPERPTVGPPIPPFMIEDNLPLTTGHDGALLFVDISGFTRISLVMNVESLSNAINSYFQMIVNEITSHGGDIIKFAGDALFAEWKVSRNEAHHDLDCCVSNAATCAAAIVSSCSNYSVCKPIDFTMSTKSPHMSRRNSALTSSDVESTGGDTPEYDSFPRRPLKGCDTRRRTSRPSLSAPLSAVIATLNVKCAIGVGHIVGIHVGDNVTRREYFILGDTIGQVARAESAAGMGQVFASPEAAQHLVRVGDLRGDWQDAVKNGQPIRIADHDEQFFEIKRRSQQNIIPCDAENMLHLYEDLNSTELQWLMKMLSLYVHPVVANDNNESAPISLKLGSYRERHVTEAELRTVYTCFISPLIDHKLTGDEVIDKKLFNLLNDIMIVTQRELNKMQGHLRQFMLDDKGLVLICTFGLRGSTFPDMVAQRALPFSLSIHRALEEDLGVKSTVGATLGKVYCGVVGGLERHEFAVLGPSVNLAARLMASDKNHGVLVDKTVRLLTTQVFFKPLPPVKAKGYDEPVPIFEPMKLASTRSLSDGHRMKAKNNFFGRAGELKQILRIAKEVTLHDSTSKLLLVTAMSGSGKSTLMIQATELVRAMVEKMHKQVIITRNISNEGDSMIPFSIFRSIFKDVLSQVQQEDEESQSSMSKDARRKSLSESMSRTSSFNGQLDTLSITSQSSRSSRGSTEMTRFRFICRELNAPPEFMEVVGKRFLGIRGGNKDDSATQSESPTLQIQSVIKFMADAFIRCTKNANLVLLALDDVQWMDELSWKVVQTIFERAENVLILCGSRPPSSSLTMDPIFFSDLQGQFQKEGRFFEISLAPLNESEVKDMIADTLKIMSDEIDASFSRNVFTTSGGMPHYLGYILDAIKRNNLTVRLENGMIGMKNSAEDNTKILGSVNELLLYRIDALDSSVRTVLHLSAVLGTEFDLLDAALAYEELFGVNESTQVASAIALRESFDVAIKEGIIEKYDIFSAENRDDEDENSCSSMINVMISLKGRRQAHPLYSENCRLRFTHDSWKTSMLNVMLDERKREMHEHVAISLERELDDENQNQDDFEKQITVFKHWKACGSFPKASASALNIGGQLMLLGLNPQAILLFDDVLDILEKISDDEIGRTQYGGISASVLDAIDVPELDKLIKLNIAKGKAYLTLGQGTGAAESYQNALDILHHTPCADDADFDRSVTFPLFSGLFVVLKMGGIKDDAECSYEQDMCKRFVEQARLNGDPIHYGRALAMEAETLGRLGNFEQALEVVERIKPIYNIETQHEAICKAYGSDRVAQAFSHSVNFNNALGRTQAALDTCNYIMEEILPKSDPKNVHNSFCLLYSVIITLKENGLSLQAQQVFQERIVAPFEKYFGPGGSTYSKPMFKPILVLLELQMKEDYDSAKIEEYTAWALDEDNFENKMATLESAWAAFSASPIALHSEICFILGKMQHDDVERRNCLIQKAITLMEKSVAVTAPFAYSNGYAKKKLQVMKSFAREEASQEMHPLV
ncbi:hypothetical protein ACHAW5_010999 [Stephanodiscus triporus]|uniref:Guanylate cyclase domain-containing protein n=1 Tax=Stephanodiscus triporus TaxID=2934178 RepID=A0ABD3MIA2_9STRA